MSTHQRFSMCARISAEAWFHLCENIVLWSWINLCLCSPDSSSSESVSCGNSTRGNRGGATRKWSSFAERRRGGMQRENRFIHLLLSNVILKHTYCMKTDSMVPQKCVTWWQLKSRIPHLPLNFLFLFMATSSSVFLSHSDFTCLLKLPQWRIFLLFFFFLGFQTLLIWWCFVMMLCFSCAHLCAVTFFLLAPGSYTSTFSVITPSLC